MDPLTDGILKAVNTISNKSVKFVINTHWHLDHVGGNEELGIPTAHTNGDVIVHFTNSNLIHSGDLISNAGYPFIDIASDGSIDGIIEGIETTVYDSLKS